MAHPDFELISALIDRPIAFQRAFVALKCGITSSLMLSQAYYWSKHTKDTGGWFYKSQIEWESETGLTRYEQEGARVKLTKLGVMQEVKRGIPCKIYYRVDFQKVYELLTLAFCASKSGESSQTGKVVINPNPAWDGIPDSAGINQQSICTQTTALITTKTTHKNTSGFTKRKPSSKPCAVNNEAKTAVCVSSSKITKDKKSKQPTAVISETPKQPNTPLEVTLENLATVLKASGIEASAAMQADAISITLTKGKALDYAVGTVKRKLASGEAAPATFAPANNLTTPSVQPVYKHPEVTVASKAVRDAALAALTVKPAPAAPVAAPDAENTAFTPLVGQTWAVNIIESKRRGEKVSYGTLQRACDELRVNKKTLNQE